jgi:hypothetical protein
MCLVVYLAGSSPLPLIPFQQDAPAFNVTELTDAEQVVRSKFASPFVVCAGSHTQCGCGFNEGRTRPYRDVDPDEQRATLESASRLVSYLREHGVQQLYACWSGDEGEPVESERRIRVEELLASDFVLQEREMLTLLDGAQAARG